jgi:hypothetical protein
VATLKRLLGHLLKHTSIPIAPSSFSKLYNDAVPIMSHGYGCDPTAAERTHLHRQDGGPPLGDVARRNRDIQTFGPREAARGIPADFTGRAQTEVAPRKGKAALRAGLT